MTKNNTSSGLSIRKGLTSAPRWVAWRAEVLKRKNASEAPTKIPYNPHNGHKARIPTDPSTWGTRKQAERQWHKLNGAGQVGGVGIVLGELDTDHLLMGIDLDSCITKKGSYLTWADDVIERFNTYTEISPSGRGAKLFFLIAAKNADAVNALLGDKLRKAFRPAGKHREMAIDLARFYAVTGDRVPDTPDTFRTVTVDDVRWFVEEAGPSFLERYKPSDESKTPARDESGSGYGYRFLQACKRHGESFEAARVAILADESSAGNWARRSDARAIKLAWDKAHESTKEYEMVCAADVVIKPLDWVWEGHLLRGAQELTAGAPGLGKSQIQCCMVACVTTGRDWPDRTPGIEPGNVIMVTAEDSREQVVVPRLIAAGADLQRVFFLEAIKHDNKRRMFLLGEDLEVLERMIRDIGNMVMVGIDPITAFQGKISSHNTTDVRGQLGPLADLAERTNVAFSTITHPPKQGSPKAIDQFIGSQAYIAAARIGHLCLPEMQPDGVIPTGRSLFTIAKNTHQKMPTLTYRIETKIVQPHAPAGDRKAMLEARAVMMETPFITWEGHVAVSADEALVATRGTKSRTAGVDDFLRDLLASGESVAAPDIYAKGKKFGFSQTQIWRASERLHVVRTKLATHWEWVLKEK